MQLIPTRKYPYDPRLGEIEHSYKELAEYDEYLAPPTSTPEQVFDILWSTARDLWPEDTAKAEAWVREQVTRYAIADVKAKAASVAQSPILWLAIGAGLLWFVSQKR
jgi:hypothetical protein